mmetsp:Transcript_75074/g.244092  ORF Transcript_75074/g.244092 Transcript_75074/m.244092 type:complete len:222 (+) Transcript_75074:2069-2734(+)
MASSAVARECASTQQEAMTTWTYSCNGNAMLADSMCSAMRFFSTTERSGGGGATSWSSVSTASSAAPTSPACAKRMPLVPTQGSTLAKSSAFKSPEEVSSAMAPSAATSWVLSPDVFKAFKTCSSVGKISPLAFGPLCNLSFHRSVAMRRTSANLSVRAMKMEESKRCRCLTDSTSTLKKSCPNFTASPSFSQRNKNWFMAKLRASKASKKRDACKRGMSK